MRRAMIRSTMMAAGALIAVVAGSAAGQEPDTRPMVAVMHFNNGAVGRWHQEYDALRIGIADLLQTELAANEAIRVVERDQLVHVMREQDLNATERVDRETAVRLGRLLGAHHMIFGSFVIDGRGAMRIDVRAVDTETSEIVYVETVSDRNDNFMVAISRLAGRMNQGMQLPAVERQVREARNDKAKQVPFKAALLYARAVADETNGNWERAAEQYRAVLAEFPDYEPAQKALARAKQGL
ncbi:MAG TPA: CsgG/HfaB family protein [Gemmatimonadaceae bacterium]|nr:CsgG/HfaB family protein [Gemmatimonadaceae bacterium]